MGVFYLRVNFPDLRPQPGLSQESATDIPQRIALHHCIFARRIAANIIRYSRLHGVGGKQVGAVLDLAHCSLAGEPAAIAIDIAWSHLLLVNLKNGCWQRIGEDENGEIRWRTYWTTSKQGLTSWKTVVNELKQRNYQKVMSSPIS